MRHAAVATEEANSVRRAKEVYVDKAFVYCYYCYYFSLVNTYYLSLSFSTSPLSEPMEMGGENEKGKRLKKRNLADQLERPSFRSTSITRFNPGIFELNL
jgi:hypothetical protein